MSISFMGKIYSLTPSITQYLNSHFVSLFIYFIILLFFSFYKSELIVCIIYESDHMHKRTRDLSEQKIYTGRKDRKRMT